MREMNARRITIAMQDGTVFHGLINIGSCRRLSDFFRKEEGTFIVLFEASIGNGAEKDVYFLNRNNILWAKPDDGFANDEDRLHHGQEEETD